MTEQLKMDAPATRHRLDEMPQQLTGQPLDRPDGRFKVAGQAPYAHEIQIDGCAHAVLVRATISKGKVKTIDVEGAKAMPGVLAVIRDDRFLRNPAQGGASKAPVRSDGTVAFFGQPIALVVAESFEAARHAAQTLSVTYEADDDGVFDPANAEVDKPEGKQLDQGDVDAAMASAAASIAVTYTTPSQI